MVAELEFAKKGRDSRLNWRDVNKIVHRTNALLNMNALMEGRTRGVGQLAVLGDRTELTIFTTQGGFGPTVPVSITVTSNKNPAIVGDSVNFTAQIVPTLSISISATGTVQFRIDGIDFGVPVTLVAGQASSANTTSLTKGDHLVEAIYSGDDNFFSNTGSMTESIKYAVSLALTSSANPSRLNQGVKWTATLTGTSINSATGTVQFYVDGVPYGAAVNVVNGKADSQTDSALSVGSHNITAHYSGDNSYDQADQSPTLVQKVSALPATYDINGPISPTYPGTYNYTAIAHSSFSYTIGGPTDLPDYPSSLTVTIEIFSTAAGGGTAVAVSPSHPAVINGVASFSITPNGPSIGFRIRVQDDNCAANGFTIVIFS